MTTSLGHAGDCGLSVEVWLSKDNGPMHAFEKGHSQEAPNSPSKYVFGHPAGIGNAEQSHLDADWCWRDP